MKDLQEIEKLWEYYLGRDHKKYWIGIKPDLSTETGLRNEQAIARLLQSVDILKSIVDFHVAGLVGRSPLVSNRNSQLIYESWRGTTSKLGEMDAISYALTKAKATGYGYLRLLKTSEGKILIHSPEPAAVSFERDDNDQIIAIEYTFIRDDNSLVERQTLLPNGLTQFEIKDGDRTESSFALDLGGKYTIQEIRLSPLVTRSTMASQDAIAHALTMIPRGNELSGFLSRFFTNARPPGSWNTQPDGTTEFIPDPDGLVIGAGIVNFLSGLPLTDAMGNTTGYTPVGVHSDPPSPIQSFVDTFNLFSAIIYLQSNQAHRLGYALTLSGRSREELRGDFALGLSRDKQSVERSLRRCLLVYQSLAGVSPDLDATVNLNLETGSLSTEEQRFILDAFSSGLITKEEASDRLGWT